MRYIAGLTLQNNDTNGTHRLIGRVRNLLEEMLLLPFSYYLSKKEWYSQDFANYQHFPLF